MGGRCVCRYLFTGLSLPLAALLGASPSLVSTAVMAQGTTGLAPLANRNPLQERSQRFQGVSSQGGMVSSTEPRASRAGVQILRQGGNAVDAAVASSFASTHPQAGNLGGGGFLVLWLPGPSPAGQRGCLDREASVETGAGLELAIAGGTAVAVNVREAAPRKAKQDLFLRPDGSVDRRRATRSLLSTGVPGSVAGLTLVQRCYGRLLLATVMAPAIRLAERGFAVSPGLSSALADAASMLQADPSSRDLFFRPIGSMVEARSGVDPAATAGPLRALRPGEILHQPALAATLRRISIAGDRGFYTGPVAHSLVTLMRQGGGLIDHGDLQAYQAQLMQPLLARFRDHPVLTMPPPSSGITLLQLLKMVEPFELASTGMNSASTTRTEVEAMNLAYRDPNALLGDPDQTEIPVQRLLAEPYITALRAGIDLHRHRPSDQLDSHAPALPTEGTNTTHLSVADRDGGGRHHHPQLLIRQRHQRARGRLPAQQRDRRFHC